MIGNIDSTTKVNFHPRTKPVRKKKVLPTQINSKQSYQ